MFNKLVKNLRVNWIKRNKEGEKISKYSSVLFSKLEKIYDIINDSITEETKKTKQANNKLL